MNKFKFCHRPKVRIFICPSYFWYLVLLVWYIPYSCILSNLIRLFCSLHQSTKNGTFRFSFSDLPLRLHYYFVYLSLFFCNFIFISQCLHIAQLIMQEMCSNERNDCQLISIAAIRTSFVIVAVDLVPIFLC